MAKPSSKLNPGTAHRDYEAIVARSKNTRDAYSGDVFDYVERLDGQTEMERQAYLTRTGYNNVVAPTLSALVGTLSAADPVVTGEFETEFSDVGAFLNISYKNVLLTSRAIFVVGLGDGGKGKLVVYSADDCINWSDDRVVFHDVREYRNPDNFFEMLCQSIFTEHYLDEEGQYRVREWSRATKKSDWVSVELPQLVVRGEPLVRLPIFPCNPFDDTWEAFAPPLLTQAQLNIQHFRMSCDLAHYEHFMALPTLTLKGAMYSSTNTSGETETGHVYVGSTKNISHIEQDAELSYVEVGGSGASIIQSELKNIEERIYAAGSRLLTNKSGVESAEALAIRSSAETASLEGIQNAMQAALNGALELVSQISGPTTIALSLDGKPQNPADRASFDEMHIKRISMNLGSRQDYYRELGMSEADANAKVDEVVAQNSASTTRVARPSA